MFARHYVWPSLVLGLFICGCGRSDRLELERTRAELEKTRVEMAALNSRVGKLDQDSATKGYLEELEKLDTLRTKGVLTQDEFDRRKQAILDGQKLAIVAKPERPAAPSSGMDELAKQLRTLASLYANSTINMQERDAKKAQLIQRPLRTTDMKKDLETVQALYGESTITLQERDALKQKLLELNTGEN